MKTFHFYFIHRENGMKFHTKNRAAGGYVAWLACKSSMDAMGMTDKEWRQVESFN